MTSSKMFKWVNTVLLLCGLAISANSSAVEKITYLHTDALGSPIAASDANGQLLWKEDYHPYGEPIRWETNDQKQLYTAQPYDDDLKLSYYGARWYDPAIGRFMGVDPAAVDPENIYSFNRYAYANNNPYKFVDPDGRLATFINANRRGTPLRQATAVGEVSNAAMELAGEVSTTAASFIPVEGVAVTSISATIKWIKRVKAAKNSKKFSTQVEKASESISDFLGEGAKLKKNKSGDPVFINKDNTKRVRFDVKNPHGDKPHGHVEIKVGKRWKDATGEHRIYLKNE